VDGVWGSVDVAQVWEVDGALEEPRAQGISDDPNDKEAWTGAGSVDRWEGWVMLRRCGEVRTEGAHSAAGLEADLDELTR
jgi:hypothetical protein